LQDLQDRRKTERARWKATVQPPRRKEPARHNKGHETRQRGTRRRRRRTTELPSTENSKVCSIPSRSPRTRHRRKKPRILRKDHLHLPRDLRAAENRENRDRRGRLRNPRRIRNTHRNRCTARHIGEVIAIQTTETVTKTNPLLNIRIEKVTINIATGKSGEPLEKAKKVLNQLTNKTPTTKLAKKAIKDWGIRKGEPIATVVTLRRDD